jgi:putative transposase
MREHREAQLAMARSPDALIAAGSLSAARPLEIVQIDHTLAEVFIVDRFSRRNIGRPWLSVAIDLATRCVVAIYLGMERPNAATVALLITCMALPKSEWLAHLGVDADWPMHGIPETLHLDNAAEFRGRALELGCLQYVIGLDYRPVGQPHYDGHIERMSRTLMERSKGRKLHKPEEKASLTLNEFEKWLALEVAQRYHHAEHRGLNGATPA